MDYIINVLGDYQNGLFHTFICVALFWIGITVIAATGRSIVLALSVTEEQESLSNGRTRGNTIRTCPNGLTSRSGLVLAVRGFTRQLRLNPPMVLALFDALATMELCGCSLECWPVRAVAGTRGLLVAIAMNTVRGAVFTCKDAYGNPTNPWYRFLIGESDFVWVAITWLLQLFGAYAALGLAELWWSLQLTTHHAARHQIALHLRQSSSSKLPLVIQPDLQVSPALGFLIEAFGSFVEFYLAFLCVCLIGLWNCRSRRSPACSATACRDARAVRDNVQEGSANVAQSRAQFLISFLFRLCINLSITSKCLGLTGNYINPANAFIQSFGIGGVDTQTHLLVYWLGPFFGVWLAVQLQHLTVKLLGPTHYTVDPIPTCSATADSSKKHSLSVSDTSRLTTTASADSHSQLSTCSSAFTDVGPAGTSISQRKLRVIS